MSVWATISAAALAGLLSWPHCAAMCGPLAVASCGAGAASKRRSARYLGARLAAYAAMGSLMGALGYRWVAHASLESFQAVAVLALVGWCAVQAARAASRHVALRPQTLTLARSTAPATASTPAREKGGGLVTLRTPRRANSGWRPLFNGLFRLRPQGAMAMGMVTAILPCGALVGAWLLAGATAHPLLGSLSMLVFAIASSPALALMVLGNELFRKVARRIPPLAGAAGWLLLALLLVGRWWLNNQTGGASCH